MTGRPITAAEVAILAGIELAPPAAKTPLPSLHDFPEYVRLSGAPAIEPSHWRREWWPIAESILMTLLYAAAVFIVTLVSLCVGRRSVASPLRLRAPRRRRR